MGRPKGRGGSSDRPQPPNRPNDRQRERGAVQLAVSANLVDAPTGEGAPRAVAYAFSAGGRLLARAPVDEKGQATLALPAAETARAVRVLVGPETEESETLLSDLRRRGAEERHLRLEPGDLKPAVELTISPKVWPCWLLGLCFVQGTLLKRIVSGGVSIDLPVCGATIEVYEVDPLPVLIPKLPDLVIERIRDIIIDPPPPPPIDPPVDPPGPFPPGPGPDPGPILRMLGMSPNLGESDTAPVALENAFAPTLALSPAPQPLAATGELQFMARTATSSQFRQFLATKIDLIRPIFCLFFPTLVTTQLVATATTDECGHFRTLFFRGCNNPDTPDLYFKAKRQIGPFTFTLLAPTPIACHTFWNYACGTEVTLYTTSPFAVTCPPCGPVIAPNNWVLFMALGNTALSRIHGSSVPLQPTTTPANTGLTDGGAPFGGTIRPRIEFDNSLRDDLDVFYYQVSVRKGTSGPFTPLTGTINRHYTHEVAGDLILEVFNLGPKVVNGVANLFEIPPALPPIGQWSCPGPVVDLASATFPTDALAPPADHGKWQIKLDLFDVNAAPVDIVAKGIKYRVPAVTDLSGDIPTADAAALGLVSGNSFIMTVHLDNNACSAEIAAPVLNGAVTANACGVLEYDPAAPGSVDLAYTASHPNGFATHSFSLYRGVTLLTPPTVSGVPVGGGSFSTTQTVNSLLGGCPVAGFSENLYVAALATDGWSRLSGYDRPAVRAFVLAPEEGP